MLFESGIVAAATLLFFSCAATQPSAEAPWRVELSTSGGFTGRGNGSLTVESSGRVAMTTMARKDCTFDASAAEIERLAGAIHSARPGSWKASYVPADPCCDRIEYRMTLERAGERHEVVWVDDPAPMPADLAAVVEALTTGQESIRVRFAPRC